MRTQGYDRDAARAFLQREARLLEQHLAACLFDGAPAGPVVDALRGYQNADGGFGHGLEPDKRCPDSLPLDVEVAFGAFAAAGGVDHEMGARACDYLASVADESGAVSLASPVIENYPRAVHWSDWAYEPGLNPTAGLAGLLHSLGVEHPWREQATEWCWSAIADGLPDDAHALHEVLVFLEHVPDQERTRALEPAVVDRLPTTQWFRVDADSPEYGVTPLDLAPAPDARWRGLFTDEQIDGHLDRLARDQQPDGGWPLTWEPPGAAPTLEYRGIVTLQAVRTLDAYDR